MSFDPENVLRLIEDVELVGGLSPCGPEGWVYFIVCADISRCKIGFTSGEVGKRMKSLQTGSAGELIMIAKHPGTQETERQLHERFARDRLHGEWFEITDELRAYMVATVWAMAEITLQCGWKLEPWMTAGIQIAMDHLGCVSQGLEELLLGEPS